MNKTILVIIIMLIIALGGYFLYKGRSQEPVSDTNLPPAQESQSETQQNNSTGAVSIKDFSFDSSNLTIKTGTTVVWTNEDSAPHQINSDDFDSSILNQGDSFQFNFQTAGTYDYYCSIHPSMKGKIVVTE